jgi:hypothetical protein
VTKETGTDAGGTSGGSGAPGAVGIAPMACATELLSDWCETKDCPTSEAAVPIDCGLPPFRVEYHRWTTGCGGSAIVRNGGTWVEAWFFASSGELMGQTFTSDTGRRCALGSFEYTSSAGELCELDESGPELCHEACPTEPCQPHATVTSDFPVPLADAAGMIFKVCRDTWCMSAQVPSDWVAGQALVLEGGAGVQSATVAFSEGPSALRLQLDWSMPNVDPAPTERYYAWLEDPVDKGRPAVDLFDVPVTYDVLDHGCAGTCLVANVDVPAR